MKLLFDISDAIGMVIEYLDVIESITLYVSCYERISIWKYLRTLTYFPFLNPVSFSVLSSLSTDSSSITATSTSTIDLGDLIHRFLDKCSNLEHIYLNYGIFDDEIELCSLLLDYLPSNEKIKTITIIIPEDSPIEIVNSCHQYIQTLSLIRNENLLSLFVDFPSYRLEVNLLPTLSRIHENCPNITEIHGLEYFDRFFYGIPSQQSGNDGLLGVACWPHLEILHIGHLINHYIVSSGESSIDSVEINSLNHNFISTFTKVRFPKVTILDFNSTNHALLMSFFAALTDYFLVNPSDVHSFIWDSILMVRFNDSFDEFFNPFYVQEMWKVEFMRLQQTNHNSQNDQNYQSRNDSINSRFNFVQLFHSILSVQLYFTTPSLQFLSFFQQSSSSNPIQFYSFFEDTIFQNYLQLFLLQKDVITKLFLFERFSDYKLIAKQTNLIKNIIQQSTTNNKYNNYYLSSFIDCLFENYPSHLFLNDFFQQNNAIKKSSRNNYDGLVKFLEVENKTLTLLHVNESFLTISFDDLDCLLFVNCFQLQSVVIELDLMWRDPDDENKQLQHIVKLQKFISYFQRHVENYRTNSLRLFQLNVWTSEQFEFVSSHLSSILCHKNENENQNRRIEVKLCLRSMLNNKSEVIGCID